MFSFDDGNWADPIAEVTTRPEFQNATIRILDTAAIEISYADYFETGEASVEGEGLVYEGPARIIGVRWGVQHGGEAQGNAYTEKSIRIQLPYRAVPRLVKGCKVFVVESPRNPVLEQLVFTVTSDFQGSMAASRTLEAALNNDVQVPEVSP